MRSQIRSSLRWREGKHTSGIWLCFCWLYYELKKMVNCFELTCFPGDPISPTTPGSPVTPWWQRQFSFTTQTWPSVTEEEKEGELIVGPLLIIPLTHCGLSGQKRRANPARRKMVSNISVWARADKCHTVSEESGMDWGQRSHLQEVPVGQHHLELHFYLEDPGKQQKGRKSLIQTGDFLPKITFLRPLGCVWLPWILEAQVFPHGHQDQRGPVDRKHER